MYDVAGPLFRTYALKTTLAPLTTDVTCCPATSGWTLYTARSAVAVADAGATARPGAPTVFAGTSRLGCGDAPTLAARPLRARLRGLNSRSGPELASTQRLDPRSRMRQEPPVPSRMDVWRRGLVDPDANHSGCLCRN